MIVQVQAILYASLTATLLSASLAMLGKQWLNQYASTDMRGTAIERSQNRQRKLNGMAIWNFDLVMQLPPFMLQIALLLLSCALSRYLWEINITVASVVLGVTLFGIISYFFIVAYGASSESCPYQTPISHALRRLAHPAPSFMASVIRNADNKLPIAKFITSNVGLRRHRPPLASPPPESTDISGHLGPLLSTALHALSLSDLDLSFLFPLALAFEMYRTLFIESYYQWRAGVRQSVVFAREVPGAVSTPEQRLDQQTIASDLRCITWMLQISLDKSIRLSALKYLVTMAVLAEFEPTLIAACFNIFTGCINVRGHKVVVVHESEELATLSARCFLRTFHHLSVTDPASIVLTDLRHRYNKIFPFSPEFGDLSFYSTMARIHDLLNYNDQWGNYIPSAQGHIPIARDVTEASRVEYQKAQRRKVPRWTLHFAFRSLSLDPLPPKPAIADCLSIIATDLGCDISDTGFTTLDVG